VEQVASWAALTNLPREVAELLQKEAINGKVLESLTEQDLLAMGIEKFGWRRELLLCLHKLREELEFEVSDTLGVKVIEFRMFTPREELRIFTSRKEQKAMDAMMGMF